MHDILDSEMTQGKFEFFREFHALEHAYDYVEVLKDSGILYKLETPSELLIDKAIVGEPLRPKAILRILPQDFTRVNQLIERMVEQNLIPEEHYLLQFSDLELFDLLEHSDEWSIEDVTLTRKILQKRGLEVSTEQIQRMKEERYQKLREGKEGEWQGMIVYLICIFAGLLFFSPLFLLGGLGMGYYYWQDKNTDPEGRRYYTFDAKTRKWGKYIFITGVAFSILYGILLLLGGDTVFGMFYIFKR